MERLSPTGTGRKVKRARWGLICLATALAGAGRAEEPASWAGKRVTRVVLQPALGGVTPEAEELLDIREGDPYSPGAVRRSIQQLFALGVFSDIKVAAEPEESGVALTFLLYPAPAISRIHLEGLEGTEAERLSQDLAQKNPLSLGTRLEVAGIEGAGQALAQRLRERGFLWAEVEPEARVWGAQAEVSFHLSPGRQARVQNLGVSGVSSPIERALRRAVRLEPGDRYDRLAVETRLQRVIEDWRKRGFYDARIDLVEEGEPPDAVGVELRVSLGPRTRIEVEGARLSPKKLNQLVPLLGETSLSADLIEESRSNLLDHFRGQGFAEARVEVVSEETGPERRVRFRVDRGPRSEVATLGVQGLHSLPAADLLLRLATRPGGRFRPSVFRESVWEKDLEEARRFLRQQGFPGARVASEIRIDEESAERRQLHLLIRVEEGARAFLDSIELEGARQVEPAEVLAAAALETGAPYDPVSLVAARERLVALYRDRGFQQASVETEAELDPSRTRARVRFSIYEGSPTLVDRVIVAGLDKTREDVVRRRIALPRGGPLSASGIADTRQKLAATGLFRDVRIDVLPTDAATGSADVLVHLKEAPRTSFGYGFGYEERELVRAEVEVTRRNLLGLNRTASVFARGSFRGDRFIFTYEQPDTFRFNFPLIATAFREEEVRTGYSYIRLGTGIQFSRKLDPQHTLFFRYNFNRTRTFDVTVDPSEIDRRFRNLRLSIPSFGAAADTRDDPIQPTQGRFTLFDLQYSARALGSQSPYFKILAQHFAYFSLPRGLVGAVALRFGLAQTFREDRDALIPITERFFAGGANTLRGFALDQASPKDPRGNPVGGNVLSLINFELRFPLMGNLGGVVFSDNGSVYRRLSVIRLLNWRYNLGIGFRYNTPLGPLRVDYGIKVDRRPDESRGQFHVTLGHAF